MSKACHLRDQHGIDLHSLIGGQKFFGHHLVFQASGILHQKECLALAHGLTQARRISIQDGLQGFLFVPIMLQEALSYARAYARQIYQFQTTAFCLEYNISVPAPGSLRSLIFRGIETGPCAAKSNS